MKLRFSTLKKLTDLLDRANFEYHLVLSIDAWKALTEFSNNETTINTEERAKDIMMKIKDYLELQKGQ